MVLSLDKTWNVSQYVINTNSIANSCNGLLVGIKNLLKAQGWSVASSSDGVTTPIVPPTDYWVDYTDIVNNTGSHSWIVLTNSNISSNFAICIDCNVTTNGHYYHNFYCSTSGYNTDGTLTTRPTVAGGGYEVTLLVSSSAWINNVTVNNDLKATLFSSSDNKCYRVYISYGIYNSIWIFDVPKGTPSWWTIPYVASIGGDNLQPTYTNYCSTSTVKIKSDLSSSTINFGLGSIGFNSVAFGASIHGRKQDFDGYYVMSPTYLISNTTARPGIYGTLYDLYWTSNWFEYALPKSSGFLKTSGNDRGLIVFGSFAQGNDGSGHTIGT